MMELPAKMRLDDFALEIFVEKIRGAHAPEAQRVVHALLAQIVEALAEVQQFLDVARLNEVGSGGSRISSGLMKICIDA